MCVCDADKDMWGLDDDRSLYRRLTVPFMWAEKSTVALFSSLTAWFNEAERSGNNNWQIITESHNNLKLNLPQQPARGPHNRDNVMRPRLRK